MASNSNLSILIRSVLDSDPAKMQQQIDKLSKKVKLNLTPRINFSEESLNKFKTELERLAKKIKVSLQVTVDKGSLTNAERAVQEAKEKMNKTANSKGSGIRVFDKEKLEAEGRDFLISSNNIVSRVKNQFKSLGSDVNVNFLKNAKDQITGFVAEVKKSDGIIEKYKYNVAKIKTDNGTQRGYVLSSSQLIDKNAGDNIQNALNKLQNYQNKIAKLQQGFTSPKTGIQDTDSLKILNQQYDKLKTKIDNLKSSSTNLSNEQRRGIIQDINYLELEIRKYKDLEAAKKPTTGNTNLSNQQSIDNNLNKLQLYENKMAKLQQGFTSPKTGIQDANSLNELNQRYNALKVTIENLKNSTTGLSNLQRRSVIQQINDLDTQIRKYRELEATQRSSSNKMLNQQDINAYVSKMNNAIARLQVGKGNVFANDNVKQELSKLQGMLNGLNINSTSNSIKQINGQFDNLRTRVSQVSSEFKNVNKDGYSFTEMLELSIKKFVLWGLGTSVVMQSLHKIQEGFQFIIEQSKVFTNLQMEMTDANLSFKGVTDTANQYANAMSTTTDTVMKAIGVFSTYTSTMDEVLEKSKAALVLSNITGQGIEQTSDALMGTMAQYKLGADDAMHVADIITSTARMLSMDYPRGIQEISDGLRTVGSVAKESGASIEELSAMVGTLNEKNRRSGTENANALVSGALVA